MRPGVSRESTDLANEGGWYAGDKIRFRSGAPEKLGGWVLANPNYFLGVCRNLTEWVSLSNIILLGLGTNYKYYIDSNQTNYDITPIEKPFAAGTVSFDTIYGALSANISSSVTDIPVASSVPFSKVFPLVINIGGEDIYVQYVNNNTLTGCTRGYNGTTAIAHTSGDNVRSSWIVLAATANASAIGNFVTVTNSAAFNAYAAADLNKNFQILAASADYVAFNTGIYPSSYQTGQGGASITAQFEFDIGPAYATLGAGWGAGIWNSMVYNAGLSTLSATINSSVTTITLASAASFPASGYVMIDSEIVQYAGVAGNSLTGCTRGATSSTATGHMMGTTVRQIAYTYATPSTSNTFRYWNYPAVTGVNIPLRLWSSDTFGQDLVYNIRDGEVFYWVASTNLSSAGVVTARGVDITTLTIGGITADGWAPKIAARVLVTDQRHVVALGTNDWAISSSSQDPLLVRWCEQENPLIWEPTQTNTAGFQRLTYGSKIITAEKTREETLIFSDSAIYSMRYLGPPYTFGFNVVSNETTIASPNAVTTTNNITYWMGLDKFYVYSGRVDTLPCALRQYVFDDINTQQLDQVYSGSNEKYNEIWWWYCSAESNQINRYVIYNYLEKLWYYGQLDRTAWYDSHIRSHPIATTNAITELVVTAGINGTITGVAIHRGGCYLNTPPSPVSTTSASGFGSGAQFSITYTAGVATAVTILGGGNGYQDGDILYVLGGSPEGLTLYHEYGLDDGLTNPPSAIASYIESADFDIGDGDSFSFVKRIIPDVDFIGSTNATPSVSMTVSVRNYPGEGVFTSTNSEISAANKVSMQVYNYTDQEWVRLRGRQVALTISSSDVGVKWQLGVPRIDIQPDGRR